MELKQGTQAVWAGEMGHFAERAAVVPVFHSVAFAYDDVDEWASVALGREPGYIYSRNTNPTVAPFEAKVAALEGAEAATAFATGMAAISNALYANLAPGKRVVSIKDSYGGTNRLFIDFLPRWGVDVTLCDTEDEAAILAAVAKGCDVLYLETPTNPTLKVVDIAKLAAAGKRVGATVMVDNTFATPINQNPLRLGADLVIHSATKFLGGHSDALGGVVCGSRAAVRRVFEYREINGGSISPMAAYLILRGMKTLSLRIERQNSNAMTLAKMLSEHPKVAAVYYPGLKSHPGHAVAAKQMRGFGGMLSFAIKGDMDAVKTLIEGLKLAHRAASLGSVSTLVGIPKTTSHVELTEEQRKKTGIPETLIRYSAGIEDVEDLAADLMQALAQA